jgi:catechol 1,2-dioxygenase
MSATETPYSKDARLIKVFDNLLDTLRNFIRENHVTHEEYRHAVAFLGEVGRKSEASLLCDVFLEVSVDEIDNDGRAGTITTIEGPFYVADAPALKSPCVLPQRPNEHGPVLFFSGTVRSENGIPLPGAILDLWQSDSNGRYSHFDIPGVEAPYNLRARVTTDQRGKFEVQTRVPGPYEIPKHGPTGALLAALGRHAWRPAHLHMKVESHGYRTLTTQLFFKNDPWIDSDVVQGAVKQSLIVDPIKHEDPNELLRNGMGDPYYTLAYDFALEPRVAEAARDLGK